MSQCWKAPMLKLMPHYRQDGCPWSGQLMRLRSLSSTPLVTVQPPQIGTLPRSASRTTLDVFSSSFEMSQEMIRWSNAMCLEYKGHRRHGLMCKVRPETTFFFFFRKPRNKQKTKTQKQNWASIVWSSDTLKLLFHFWPTVRMESLIYKGYLLALK